MFPIKFNYKVVMFICCTKEWSVINSIYSGQELFSYCNFTVAGFKPLNLRLFSITGAMKCDIISFAILSCGLYYKLITIVIDAASVTLQIVASLSIVIDDAS